MLAQASGVSAQTAEIRLVALPSASLSDSVTTLPTSSIRFLEDAPFIVEVWAQTPDNRGLSSVSADFTFTSTLANITNIAHTPLFNVLTAGTVNNTNGTIDNLSGSHLGPCTDAVGASPNWARVAILGVTPTGIGTLSLQSGSTNSPIYGTAICGLGNIADGQIVFGAVAASLVECLTDVECDDGQFCNGAETCNPTTFICAPGTPPVCNDNIACTVDTCDPLANGGTGACTYTPNNTLCDNLLFCDGVETCDAIQGCLAGAAPCSAECEHCVEDADACDHCIFDLDGSAVMGTGDFSFFAPCFGACYPPGNPCLESNFDGDLAGCIGTSDFAAFAGCFGLTCGQCSGCSGPGGGMEAGGAVSSTLALDSPAVIVRLVTRRAPSTSDTLWAPPHSDSIFTIGEHIYFEVWASNQSVNPLNLGLASAFVDLQFGERQLALLEVIPSDALGLLAGHSISTKDGMLRALGGCAQLGGKGVGAIGSWIRVTTVVARAVSPGRTPVAVESSDDLHGFSMVGMFENIDSSLIDFQGATIEIQKDGRTRDER
ncbi:MAG: hypothetical protein L0Z07_08920 [Planctomycetes bacterium]|nr:hypothetical protein [Planctomycetota bacterium]